MSRSIRLYVVAVTGVFWVIVALSQLIRPVTDGQSLAVIAPLLGIAIAAEALVISREGSSASFSVAAHIAAAILFGPLAAGLVAAVAVLVVDGLRSGLRAPVFLNSSVFGLSAWAGGCAFLVTGGTVGTLSPREMFPVLVLIGVRFVVNEVLVSVAIALASGFRLLRVLRDELRDLVGAAVGEGCLGVLVAFGYSSGRWMILPFLVPLLATLYRSQLNLDRLRQETAAALNAFAGVIDERDVNTARHSERVANYVERLCQAIQLPERETERLVRAARFHDLGKVAIDVATLTRDGRLNPEELRAIRSHPRLSARLLSPFHFAQEMAVYAELHHERYDGKGYYSVPQRDIPVEAHVLIVADSFDAMTSPRAYRPALTEEDAVQEIRDQAGSQFHPRVARAFAAMIEQRDVPDTLGHAEIDGLRREFARVPVVALPPIHRLLQPRLLAVGTVATLFILVGLPDPPWWIMSATLIAALTSTGVSIYIGVSQRRRRRQLLASAQTRGTVDAALRAAGIPGFGIWLRFDTESEHYQAQPTTSDTISSTDGEEIGTRASRAGRGIATGQLESGRYYAISPVRSEPRLAVCSTRKLSAFEQDLLLELATLAAPGAPTSTSHPLPRSGTDRSARLGLITIELHAFDDIRKVAGQLVAERVVGEAAGCVRALLREGDMVGMLDEDTIVVTVSVADQTELNAISDRIRESLRRLLVPKGADALNPSLRAEINPPRHHRPDRTPAANADTPILRATGS